MRRQTAGALPQDDEQHRCHYAAGSRLMLDLLAIEGTHSLRMTLTALDATKTATGAPLSAAALADALPTGQGRETLKRWISGDPTGSASGKHPRADTTRFTANDGLTGLLHTSRGAKGPTAVAVRIDHPPGGRTRSDTVVLKVSYQDGHTFAAIRVEAMWKQSHRTH